jgi:4a-hydroxytetrahydrobiopterin dehydratase
MLLVRVYAMKTAEVTLYTRRDCPLCDTAKSAIRAAVQLHRLPVVLYECDVDLDPDLHARFTNDVPVIYVDGVEAFRHRVDAAEFASYIRNCGGTGMSSPKLADDKCIPCRGGVPPLETAAREALLAELGNGWRVIDGHHLEKEFAFPDFAQALAFTNRIGTIAEEQGHHPDILLRWGSARVQIWTHKIDGLTRSDFVLAAKIENAA